MNQVTISFWVPPKSIEVASWGRLILHAFKRICSRENCFVYQVKARLAAVCWNPHGGWLVGQGNQSVWSASRLFLFAFNCWSLGVKACLWQKNWLIPSGSLDKFFSPIKSTNVFWTIGRKNWMGQVGLRFDQLGKATNHLNVHFRLFLLLSADCHV